MRQIEAYFSQDLLLRQGTTLLLTVALFVVMLLFVPNTRVRIRPALAGGLVLHGDRAAAIADGVVCQDAE